jgi:receptor protein-tyrosine kinase
MSLIEQAAKRLEELRRAGVEIPDTAPKPRDTHAATPVANEVTNAKLQVAPAAQTRRQRSGIAAAPTSEVPVQRTADDPQSVHIDLAHLAAKGIVTPDAPRAQTADEFRVIKRPLIVNATGRGAAPIKQGNLIMVTSALPGEGKSFTAVNLAMSIAMELDHTVLLVDADVARPTVPGILGVPATRGLLDVLVDDGGRPEAGAVEDEHREAVDPAERNQTPQGDGVVGQRVDEPPASGSRHPVFGSHHRFRFTAASRDDRGARVGHAYGAGDHRR